MAQNVGTDVEALDWVVDKRVVLLLHYLRSDVAKSASSVGTAALLESLHLNDKDLGRGVDLELLRDVTVLLADVAVPLIVAT